MPARDRKPMKWKRWIVVCPREGLLNASLSILRSNAADFASQNCPDKVIPVLVTELVPKRRERKGRK